MEIEGRSCSSHFPVIIVVTAELTNLVGSLFSKNHREIGGVEKRTRREQKMDARQLT